MSESNKPAENVKPQQPAKTDKPSSPPPDKFRVERMICNDSVEGLQIKEKSK